MGYDWPSCAGQPGCAGQPRCARRAGCAGRAGCPGQRPFSSELVGDALQTVDGWLLVILQMAAVM
jgi:hypothetical protein